jgi:uncharacterized protein (DUF302 family)
MKKMAFEFTLDMPFGPALDAVIAALKEEGFGVLTRIDVHDTLKEKMGVDFRKYAILGACNPPLAHKALSSRPEVGLVLPCNVVVEESGDAQSRVRILDPGAMMQAGGFADDPVLAEVGAEAEARLRRVSEALQA